MPNCRAPLPIALRALREVDGALYRRSQGQASEHDCPAERPYKIYRVTRTKRQTTVVPRRSRDLHQPGIGTGGGCPYPDVPYWLSLASPGPSGGGDDGGRGEGHRGEGGGRGGAGEFGRDMGRVMSPEPTSLEPGGGGSEAAEAAAGSHIMESTAARSAQQQLRNNYGGTELENRD